MPIRRLVTALGSVSWCSMSATVIFGFTALNGCTTVTTQSFKATPNARTDSSYIATDADFSKYNKLVSGEMGIFFPPNSPIPADDLQRIRQTFRNAFLGQLEGHTIVDTAGPATIRVEASLIDLRYSASTVLPGLRPAIRDIARPGSLLFLMELRDSESDRVLARAADNMDTDAAPVFARAGSDITDWDSIETAAQRWAELFREFVDRNLQH